MTETPEGDPTAQAMLDSLGPAVLIFDGSNRLVAENAAARSLLGTDLKLIRIEGWTAAALLFNTRLGKGERPVELVRREALATSEPVRFHVYRAGEYIPGWTSAFRDLDGEPYTLITLEIPDWTALREMLDKFIEETRAAADATLGHAELIGQTAKRARPNETSEQIGKRINGFVRLISTHMRRLGNLMDCMERLEDVRTGHIREEIAERRRRIALADWIEDFLEELDYAALLDPESAMQDVRGRIRLAVPEGLAISAPTALLATILRDILRNAIMYSMRGTPVVIQARGDDRFVQIDVVDEGYGVRTSETERVFMPFQRARQPQIIAEFGYGLSLFLCKHEVEAMSGRMWFESEESVGSTFSLKLPVWREQQTGTLTSSASDSSSASTR
jgi:signal transduction histidine kinase